MYIFNDQLEYYISIGKTPPFAACVALAMKLQCLPELIRTVAVILSDPRDQENGLYVALELQDAINCYQLIAAQLRQLMQQHYCDVGEGFNFYFWRDIAKLCDQWFGLQTSFSFKRIVEISLLENKRKIKSDLSDKGYQHSGIKRAYVLRNNMEPPSSAHEEGIRPPSVEKAY